MQKQIQEYDKNLTRIFWSVFDYKGDNLEEILDTYLNEVRAMTNSILSKRRAAQILFMKLQNWQQLYSLDILCSDQQRAWFENLFEKVF